MIVCSAKFPALLASVLRWNAGRGKRGGFPRDCSAGFTEVSETKESDEVKLDEGAGIGDGVLAKVSDVDVDRHKKRRSQSLLAQDRFKGGCNAKCSGCFSIAVISTPFSGFHSLHIPDSCAQILKLTAEI
jgi:hypothetical protein